MLLFIFVQMYTWGQPRLPNMNDSVTSFLYHPESSLLDSMFRGIFGGCLLGMFNWHFDWLSILISRNCIHVKLALLLSTILAI
jgi:hypothetical protein